MLLCSIFACSNEKDVVKTGTEIDLTDKLQITLNAEQFNNENEVATRAIGSVETTDTLLQPELVDLGDGLAAEISITADELEATRTQPVSDGHYQIYVLGADGKTMGPPLQDKKLSGTFAGGKFTKDAGSYLRIEPGTYTFICANDLADPGYNTNSYNARVGLMYPLVGKTTKQIDNDNFDLTFDMKHALVGRMRVKLTAYTNSIENVAYQYDHLFKDVQIGFFNNFPTVGPSFPGTNKLNCSFPNTPVGASATHPFAYEYVSNYVYTLEANHADRFSMTFTGGKVYGLDLTGKTYKIEKALIPIQRNGSYTVNVKLRPKGIYLFEDGTVGTLASKGPRTPVGLVIGDGLAVALKDAAKWFPWKTTVGVQDNDVSYNRSNADDWSKLFSDKLGYHWTWEKSGSKDGTTVKAEKTEFGVFYAAGNYNPGIATHNIGKWFVPSMAEWALMVSALGGGNLSTLPHTGFIQGSVPWNATEVNKLFTDAGGNALAPVYYASNEYTTFSCAALAFSATQVSIQNDAKFNGSFSTRAFVHF